MSVRIRPSIHDDLRRVGACEAARIWAKGKSAATIWATCRRGDWLAWWVGRCSGPLGSAARKKLVKVLCECARLRLSVFEAQCPDDKRPRTAIETAERYVAGKATIDQVRIAGYAAYAASDAADAASAAAFAASAADAAAYAAADPAPDAADAASDAADADIIRKHYKTMPRLKRRKP